MAFQPKQWLLRRRLKARSPDVRRQIVRDLGAQGDAEAVTLLLEARNDADPAVRAEVVAALAGCKDERILGALLAALRDPDLNVRLAAIAALQRQNDPAAVPALVSALMQGAPEEKWRAARALDAFHWRPRTEAEEIQFCLAMGEIARAPTFGAAAIKPLVELLRHGSFEQRVAAVNALGEINDPAVVRPLQQALRDADPLVRTAAAHALARVGDAQVVPALIQALKDRETNARVAAATALGRLGDARAVEPLIQLLNDPEWEARAAALEALGKLGDPRALQPVAARLDDKDQEVRQYAADAVARVGDESVVQKLVLTLVDSHSGVRQAAARALTRLDPNWERSERVRKLLPALEAAARKRDAAVQTAASQLIKRITGRGEDDATTLAADPAERRRRAALRALEDMAKRPEPLARAAALQTLLQMGGPAARDAEKLALAETDERVRAVFVASGSGDAGGLAPAARRLHVAGLALCGARGEVLHAGPCDDPDFRARLLAAVRDRASELVPGATLGEFERLEIPGPPFRQLCLVGETWSAWLAEPAADAPTIAVAATSAVPLAGRGTAGTAVKEQLAEWLRRAPSCPGALVRAVWFPDRTISCDVDARDFSAAALEQASRLSAEVFELFERRADAPSWLSWCFQRAMLHCARRREGSTLVVVTGARLGEREWTALRALGAEFCGLNLGAA